jgi:recombination protein RecA
MRCLEIERYKETLTISSRQQEILIGTLLGDAHIELGSHHPRIKIEHSIAQREYVDWKYHELRNLVRAKPRERTRRYGTSYGFNTLALRELWSLHEIFGKKKELPNDIGNLITPLALAIWFMDDGSVKSKECNGLYFQTQGYSSKSRELLIELLQNKYRIESYVVQDNRLYLPARSGAENLRKVINELVIPGMRYKLGIRVNSMPKA